MRDRVANSKAAFQNRDEVCERKEITCGRVPHNIWENIENSMASRSSAYLHSTVNGLTSISLVFLLEFVQRQRFVSSSRSPIAVTRLCLSIHLCAYLHLSVYVYLCCLLRVACTACQGGQCLFLLYLIRFLWLVSNQSCKSYRRNSMQKNVSFDPRTFILFLFLLFFFLLRHDIYIYIY